MVRLRIYPPSSLKSGDTEALLIHYTSRRYLLRYLNECEHFTPREQVQFCTTGLWLQHESTVVFSSVGEQN